MVSFITVDYNGLEVTCALLESLKKHVCNSSWEAIVVDNGSKENEAAAIAQRYPWAKTIRSEKNLGFAGGNNLGIKEAQGDCLFFVNNDTEIFEDKLESLTNVFAEHPQTGMVCPKICFFDSPGTIQYAGYTPMRGIRMKNEMIGYGKTDDGNFDTPSSTAFPHGAAMMVSRSALEKVGPMPECYFLYYEELDWGEMFRRAGFEIRYQPTMTVFHKDSVTTGRRSPLSDYYMLRGRQIFAERNLKGLQRAGALLFTRWVAVPKRAAAALLSGRKANFKALFKANRDFKKMKKGGELCF